jgi:Cysteine rich repeat
MYPMYLRAFAASVMMLMPLAASAQTTAPAPTEAMAKIREACGPDVQKFCANVERAKGKMRECLDSHKAELSPACVTARAERASR